MRRPRHQVAGTEGPGKAREPPSSRVARASGAAVVASTTVGGRHWLKFTLLNPRTTIDDIAKVWEEEHNTVDETYTKVEEEIKTAKETGTEVTGEFENLKLQCEDLSGNYGDLNETCQKKFQLSPPFVSNVLFLP